MRKVKVYDKDLNFKQHIDDIDGGVTFSVTENGFGPLDFTAVGDVDIDQADIVKVVDTDGQTVETIVSNNNYLVFDGVNDYMQSGTSIARRGRGYMTVGTLSFSSDGYGSYYTNFDEGTNTNYIDVGLPFSEIALDKQFSFKFVFQSNSVVNYGIPFFHNNFGMRYIDGAGEYVIGFVGGPTKSFPVTTSTYYRVLVTYDGSNINVWYNGVSATGTTSLSMVGYPYCLIGNAPGGSSSMGVNTRWYNTCLWDRVLTAGEITSENGSHTTTTTTNRVWNISADVIGTGTVDNIVTSGIVSGDLTASTNTCISGWFMLGADGIADADSMCICLTPYIYVYVRDTTNMLRIRFDSAGARESTYTIGNGDREWHHFVGVYQVNGANRQQKLWVDGVIRDTDNQPVALTKYTDYIMLGKKNSRYYNGGIKDIRIHTFTGTTANFDDNDADMLYKGLEPIYTAGITEYKRYAMNEGSGTITGDATINGATRESDDTAQFVNTHNRVVENEIYYGQVVSVKPRLQATTGKRTDASCLGIQTVLNDVFMRGPSGTTTYSGLLYPNYVMANAYDLLQGKYIDFGDEDILDYNNWLEDRRWYRQNMYVVDGADYSTYRIAQVDQDLPIVIEKRLPISPVGVGYFFQFYVKSVSGGAKTLKVDYAIEGDSYFTQNTYTLTNDWQRISVLCARGGVSGTAVRFKLTATMTGGSFAIRDFKVYREDDTNIPKVMSDILDINYNNTKAIIAFQDAVKYSGGKIKWIVDKYPVFFGPDITGTPNHYIIEEKHLSYIEKGETSDEIVNSVQVEYDGGITSKITDATSISNYRLREGIISSTLGDATSAGVYGNVWLQDNKDPKVFVKAVVTRAYPIHTLRVGDLVQITGNTLDIERGYITRLDMGENSCTIYLNHYDGLGKSLLKI